MFTKQEQALIDEAIAIIRSKFQRKLATPMNSPEAVRAFLALLVEGEERENFGALYLDTQNFVIKDEILFIGTLAEASVWPREVVKAALLCNASALIVFHNHPSGVAEPSQADRQVTRRLSDALALVGISILDHFVIGHDDMVSFAERGWI